jgi:PPK2 family polyphosphate:nucleotide phosphotransferase
MKPEDLAKIVSKVRIDKPDDFKLKNADPADRLGLGLEEPAARLIMSDLVRDMAKQQELLFADGGRAVLVIIQAMDAAGKDTVIEHVFSGINPAGCRVTSFKQPSAEEQSHDFLWRTVPHLPPRGTIGVFNRSYYEETLVVRVHPEWLGKQKIAPDKVGKDFWQDRFESINALEKHLHRNGTTVLKFHLRISREEQRKRFLDRLNDPDKNWKFSLGDLPERARWDDYMTAYEDMIRATSTKHAPWHVIPADHKWTSRVAVGAVVLDALNGIAPKPPKLSADELAKFARAKDQLEAEGPPQKGQQG